MPTLRSKSNHRKSPLRLKCKTIGITLGDPQGIGPEVIAKALNKCPRIKNAHFLIVGDKISLGKYFKRQLSNCTFIALPFSKNVSAGKRSYCFLTKAIELIKNGTIQGLVTGPVSKEAICKVSSGFRGHTEFLGDAFVIKHVGMLFVAKKMRTIIVTRHIPLNKVSQMITKSMIVKTLDLTYRSLRNNFKIKNPFIGVCGINPHAGEGGIIGKEEIKTVIPAINHARNKHINCVGPFAADTLFTKENCYKYDAIVAMYHDQGLIPIKTLYFNELVNLTIGLPFIRTSPAHGTAFDIAGKNKANPSSMFEAIKLAVQLS